jgi:hypothetical protein
MSDNLDWAEAAEAVREQTAELLPWLRRTIATAEQVAQDAAMRKGPVWEICPQLPYRWGQDEKDTEILGVGKPIITCDYEYGGLLLAEHIVRHDPQAVLAQCEAHTRLLNVAEGMATPDEALIAPFGQSVSLTQVRGAAVVASSHMIALVGLAYQYWPGYREEWKP